jgi:hypothetical protein
MIVKCLQEKPSESQVEILGDVYKNVNLRNDSHLTVGNEYLALGMVMNTHYPNMGKGAWVILQCDHEHVEKYPIVLFEVLDGRIDLEWVVCSRSDGIVEIQPELFYQDYFFEDYLDGVPEVVKPFKELLRRMEQRARAEPPSLSSGIPRIN